MIIIPMINMLSIRFPHHPFLHHDGSCFVPRTTALYLLCFAMIGLVLLCVVARHYYELRRGFVVMPMSGDPAACPEIPSRVAARRRVAADGRGCIAGSQRGVGE